MTDKEFSKSIFKCLSTYDWTSLEEICKSFIEYLYAIDTIFKVEEAEIILKNLRRKRKFLLMLQIGNALIQTGRYTLKIKLFYAQALIDLNNSTAAISILNQIISETESDKSLRFENAEGRGMLARVFKQLYINHGAAKSEINIGHLHMSIQGYLDMYYIDPESYTWHGINAVALLKRGMYDLIDVSMFPDAEQLAHSILRTIEEKNENQTANEWDFATASEACIALNKSVEALRWLSGYVRMPYCDSFELASTLRQFTEVWKLDLNTDMGQLLLPLLQAALLQEDGGSITVKISDISKQVDYEKGNQDKLRSLISERTKIVKGEIVLEKVFGKDSFTSLEWLSTALRRCLTIARIGTEVTKGIGTGFLVNGAAIHPSLGEELILLTNSHVVSINKDNFSITPDQAIVIFEALSSKEEFLISEIIWSSPSNELDVAILRFDSNSYSKLLKVTSDIQIYPLSNVLPVIDLDIPQKVYIIGHPFGGTLQFSFEDNILLDYENPKIHYRTPTEGGSSGSPVFNQQWKLIGLHHAGGNEMPCLNGKSGTYNANEGIWIEAIKNAFIASLSSSQEI